MVKLYLSTLRLQKTLLLSIKRLKRLGSSRSNIPKNQIIFYHNSNTKNSSWKTTIDIDNLSFLKKKLNKKKKTISSQKMYTLYNIKWLRLNKWLLKYGRKTFINLLLNTNEVLPWYICLWWLDNRLMQCRKTSILNYSLYIMLSLYCLIECCYCYLYCVDDQ